jgi:ADP-heptose:LPS heptosyltransferase
MFMPIQTKEANKSILVYKSYGGLGDIFFTLPALYLLKQQFNKVTFATQPRLVSLFKSNLEHIEVVDENEVVERDYDRVIELGNYPRFHNDAEKQPQLVYHTHKKVKQHAIEHYKDGIVSAFPDIQKTNDSFPYFKRKQSSSLYYTVHAGAGFILKAWPLAHFAQLIEFIADAFPTLTAKLIIGPNDPNPATLFTSKNVKYELITGGIDEVADAISGAQFHIGNDAGITHLAGAFNIPILTIYGPTGPGSWGAFSEKVELIWGKKGNCNLRCRYEVILNCPSRVCLSNVSPQKMLYFLYKLLNRIQENNATKFALNPDFKIQIETDHFILKNKENEYLIEINDAETQAFVQQRLTVQGIETAAMPAQFKEVFDALVDLNLFQKIPTYIEPHQVI